MRKGIVRNILLGVVVIVIALQFIRPSRVNPPVVQANTLMATAAVPPAVGAVIDRACADCHSSTTRWPWYSQVAPMSWLLADHVAEGRKELSFSNWGTYSPVRQARKLGQICSEVKEGEMPLPSYLWMHSDARLTDGDRQALCAWTASERTRLVASGKVSPKDLEGRPRKPSK